MRAQKYKCGCKSDDQRWLAMCETHKAEWLALHTQAQTDYRAQEDARKGKKP
jgi:hypothetical protein